MPQKRSRKGYGELLGALCENIKRYWPELHAQRRLVILSMLALVVSVVARVFEPWPLKFIFDFIIVPTNDAATALLGRLMPASVLEHPSVLLVVLVLIFVVLVSLRAAMIYFSKIYAAVAAARIVTDIRQKLFDHLQRLTLAFHHRAKSGDLVTRFTYDINRLRDVTAISLIPFVVNILSVFAMIAIMAWLSLELTLIILAVVPLFYLFSLRSSTQLRKVVKEQRRRDGAVAASAAESIGAISIVQAFSLAKVFGRAFAKHNAKSQKKGAQAQRLSARMERNIDVLIVMATALVLWRGVQLVVAGQISAGTLLIFLTYLGQTFRPVRQSAKHVAQLAKALASADRVGEVLDTSIGVEDQPGAVNATGVEGHIRFEQVAFGYKKRQRVMRKFDLDVMPGQRVAVVGPSGAGKSTLLCLLLRLYDPNSGRVLLDGRDIREFTLESLRRQMSILLQDSPLFAVSIRDNIAYGRIGATPEEVEAAARLANAHEFIVALPDGYDTVVGERGATLSGGQRQRIALARAVIRQAPVMILDEPTAGLDRSNTWAVMSSLESCCQGRTTLLVTHNLHVAARFDNIYYMENGRVVEDGTHAELIERRGPYWRLWHQQSTGDVPIEGQPSEEPSLKVIK